MGSLASRPSVPQPQPQIVFVPASIQTTSGINTNSSTPTAAQGGEVIPNGPTGSEQRVSSLLQRSRGRFGTIQTSFRGLLNAAMSAGQRKTLLGE